MAKAKKQTNRKARPEIDVVIETPKGSRNKYAYDEKARHFRLSKVLPEGMMFPYDFGFVPGTRSEDGDPLDVLVLMDEPTFPGCVVECRLIGVLQAKQEEDGEMKRNDRLIAVADASQTYADIRDISDLGDAIVRQIEGFFVNYQVLRDVRFTVLDRKGRTAAANTLRANRDKKAA
jgi:inorganic pyrophosphatase